MIRHITAICVVLFIIAGFYDYQTSHEVDLVDQQIATVRENAAEVRSDSKLLQTEWESLDSASNLQPLAAQFLKLQQATPNQFVTLAQMAQQLPAPGAAPQTAEQLAQADEVAAKANQEVAAATPVPVAAATPVSVAAATPVSVAEAPEVVTAAQPAPVRVFTTAKTEIAANTAVRKPVALAQPKPVVVASAAPVALKPVAPAQEQPQPQPVVVAENDVPVVRPAPVAAKPKSHPAAPKPVYVAEAAPPAMVAAHPAPQRQVLMADNEPASRAPTQTYSALGGAQSSMALPAPVAVSDVAWRSSP